MREWFCQCVMRAGERLNLRYSERQQGVQSCFAGIRILRKECLGFRMGGRIGVSLNCIDGTLRKKPGGKILRFRDQIRIEHAQVLFELDLKAGDLLGAPHLKRAPRLQRLDHGRANFLERFLAICKNGVGQLD
ncbi:hypothetical protein [Roseivivax sp.]